MHQDAIDNNTVLAFSSILNLDAMALIAVNASKKVEINLNQVLLTGFNVTTDNLGGSVKAD